MMPSRFVEEAESMCLQCCHVDHYGIGSLSHARHASDHEGMIKKSVLLQKARDSCPVVVLPIAFDVLVGCNE
jgi:hypothetical protein